MGQTCCSSHFSAMLLGACRRCWRGGTPWPNANQFPPPSGWISLTGSRVVEAEARPPAGEFRNQNFPINGALILRGRTGEASDRTRRAGEPRCPMFEMLQTEEGVL